MGRCRTSAMARVGLTANWVPYASIALLTVALAVNWAITTTKLSLQKRASGKVAEWGVVAKY